MPGNTLYYGDNLDILRRYIDDESVDLVYLDPPFNSNADYNVLFAEKSTERSHAQIKAFEDTWEWDTEAAASFADAVQNGGEHVAKCMSAFRTLLGASDMLAYLSMMAPRLVELRRVMRETASIYLHCDSTASHYLKMLMDAVFRPENFRNEIIWKRRVGSSSAVHSSNRFGDVTDTILFYAKSPASLFHPQYNKDTEEYQQYIRERFTLVDDDGRLFQATSLVNPAPRPNLKYEYKGYHDFQREDGGMGSAGANLFSERANQQIAPEKLRRRIEGDADPKSLAGYCRNKFQGRRAAWLSHAKARGIA
jgi:site-specific DNA-methyltransferase (adenine-specific)